MIKSMFLSFMLFSFFLFPSMAEEPNNVIRIYSVGEVAGFLNPPVSPVPVFRPRSSYVPIYGPVITMVPSGTFLYGRSYISRDRRRVRISINPSFYQLMNVHTFSYR